MQVEILPVTFRKLQELFEAHQASDSVYQYDDLEAMIESILYRVATARHAPLGSSDAALLNILHLEPVSDSD